MHRGDRSSAPYTPRFAALKRSIIQPEDESKITQSWSDLLAALRSQTEDIKRAGSAIIPQVDFDSLSSLEPAKIDEIKRKGCVVIRGVVDETVAAGYKQKLEAYIQANPTIQGFPADNKQFFELYWSESQLRARSNPNVLAASAWLSSLFHAKETSEVSLSTPLVYADRFRIRKPGTLWTVHSPHIDGGSIERWEDPVLRKCFERILTGNWRDHDPFDLTYRLEGNTDIVLFSALGKDGWLCPPGEGTIRFFPDVNLSIAYIMLRPFFKPLDENSNNLDPANWVLDVAGSPTFDGVERRVDSNGKESFRSIFIDQDSHPHLDIDHTMTSAPKVKPGDMVFWHCDMIHSVETEHKGVGDSAVMYIPAVPLTIANAKYVARQRDSFLAGLPGPDFPQYDSTGESKFVSKGLPVHIESAEGGSAMGLKPFNTSIPSLAPGEKEVLAKANVILGLGA